MSKFEQHTGPKTPLANILLKVDVIGNTIPLKFVTPAQLLYLIADNHANAGGNPITKLTEIPEDAEVKPLKALYTQLQEAQEKVAALKNENHPEEVYDRLLTRRSERVERIQNQINQLQGIQALRVLTPTQERIRLSALYGTRKIKKLYPGTMPTLPTSWEEAQQAGITTETLSTKLVGSTDEEP